MGDSKWATEAPQVTPSNPQLQATVPCKFCSVCGGRFNATALAGHQTKCKVWAARVAPKQYTEKVAGRLAIVYPPNWACSHFEKDPDPEWLISAKEKVKPIRNARAAEMLARRKAGQYSLAAIFEKETMEIEEQAAKQAEAARKAEAPPAKKAEKAQPAEQTTQADAQEALLPPPVGPQEEAAKKLRADALMEASKNRLGKLTKGSAKAIYMASQKGKKDGKEPPKPSKPPVKKHPDLSLEKNGEMPNRKK